MYPVILILTLLSTGCLLGARFIFLKSIITKDVLNVLMLKRFIREIVMSNTQNHFINSDIFADYAANVVHLPGIPVR